MKITKPIFIIIFLFTKHLIFNKEWNYGNIHIFGDSQAPFCFTNHPYILPSSNIPKKDTEQYKTYEKSFFNYVSKEINLNIQFIIHWLIGRTMHRIGREGLSDFNIKEYEVNNNDIVAFCFGCIDIGSHIYRNNFYRQIIIGRKLNEIISTLVKNYITTIISNQKQYNTLKIVIIAVPPPFIFKPTEEHFLKYLPNESFLKLQVETTTILNKYLENYCKENNFLFLNLNEFFQNEVGTLKKEISDGSHHIHPKYNNIFKEKLISLLREEKP